MIYYLPGIKPKYMFTEDNMSHSKIMRILIDDEEVELTPAESEEAEGETSEPSAEFDDEGAQDSQIEETPSTNIAAEDNLSASEALEVSTDIE